MRRLLLTLESPAANLALDEALLDRAEAEGFDSEYLRLWESPQPMVVLGRSSRVEQEVDSTYCATRDISILRRSSGGAAIVAGPGCLMYALVLGYERRPQMRGIPETHCYVLTRIAEILKCYVPTVQHAGTSDLAFVDVKKGSELFSAAASENSSDPFFLLRKFSGNSLRVKRTHCLYHGTMFYDFDLPLVSKCLTMPARQPDYRRSRGHDEFVANLPLSRSALQDGMLAAWPTNGDVDEWPRSRVDQLVAERYGRDEWNLTYGRAASDRS